MTRLLLAVAALLLMIPATGMAQAPAMPAPGAQAGGPPPEMQQAMMAAMQLQMKLQALQQKALTDPSLNKERIAFESLVEAKMIKIDPAAKSWITDMKALSESAKGLQEKGDQAGLQALSTKARPIMEKLQKVQQQVMADPEVATSVKALDTKVKAKMLELDATVPQMEQQLKALSMKLNAGRGAMMPPPGAK